MAWDFLPAAGLAVRRARVSAGLLGLPGAAASPGQVADRLAAGLADTAPIRIMRRLPSYEATLALVTPAGRSEAWAR